uniref:Major facilitator superfamily (MFS) profile domain-containing protein n=1 Tax=Ciona intestinalis TaxID=7719 RepID=F6RLF9_CIOIN
FSGAMPDSRCRIEPYDNITSYPNLTKTEITTTFIPLNDNTKKPDRCQRYAFNTSCKDIKDLNCLFGTNNVSGMQTVQCDAGYEYDRSSFEETIVTEWDLVCDKVGISFIATSLNYAGLLTGSLMGGLLADRLVPESPRWLFAHNKQAQSKQVCEVMAKRNKTQLSEEVWQDTMTEFNTSEKTEIKESKESPLRAMCRLPCTRFLMLCNMFVWMVTSMVYYGLVLNVGNLPGGVYLNNTLGGLMEFTACVSSIFAIKKIGFTKLCIRFVKVMIFMFCFYLILCYVFEVFETLSTVLAMVGRFAASMSFGVIYVHTTEMFPTVGRSTALGLSSMSARIGSIFSPFTIQLHLTIPWLTPYIQLDGCRIEHIFILFSFPFVRKLGSFSCRVYNYTKKDSNPKKRHDFIKMLLV